MLSLRDSAVRRAYRYLRRAVTRREVFDFPPKASLTGDSIYDLKSAIGNRESTMFTLCLVLVTFLAGPASAQPDPGDDPNEYENQDVFTTPVISEFMASNGSKEPLAEGELLDEDGESSDWIEIYNPTDQAVHLGGWYLTNDAGNLEQWKFPTGVALNPGQFLVVFASGKTGRQPAANCTPAFGSMSTANTWR